MYAHLLINYNVLPDKTDFSARILGTYIFLTEDITLYHALI